MADFDQLYQAVLNGNAATARSATEQALAEGVGALELVNQAMVPAMAEAGRRFECSEYFVPELLISARAMKASLELLRPLLKAGGGGGAGRVAIGTVQGDIHDIGKNLVAALLEGGGFEVVDLGVNVPPEKFIEAVRDKQAQIVAISALLTTTMPAIRSTIDAIRLAGLRAQVKVLVGGAPITQRYADEVGADGYSDNAAGAVMLARRVLAAA